MKKIVTQLLIYTLGTMSLIFSQDDGVSLTIDSVDEENQTFDILYSSPVDIAGFQFDMSGIAITSIDQEIDGLVDSGNNTVLGISLTGEVLLPATSSAILMTIHYELDGSGSDICLSNLVFAGVGGDELSVSAGDCYPILSNITISYGDVTNTTPRSLDINYESTVDINGFQLTIEGVDLINVESDFYDNVIFNNNTGTIIAFSLSGDIIPAGAGTFLSIEFGGEGEADICILDPAFSAQIDGQNDYVQVQYENTNCQDIAATWYDCNGDPNGTAYEDYCGDCVGGNTGYSEGYNDQDLDGVCDDIDNCVDIYNPEQEDNDGCLDEEDDAPLDDDDDYDEDGTPDDCDDDDDNDGALDDVDSDDNNEFECSDDDDDKCDDCDDGTYGLFDDGENHDDDGICDLTDPDDDDDGCIDLIDIDPVIYSEDTDGNGFGNDCDPDDDGDGCLDVFDDNPLKIGGDYDGDGTPDDCDDDDDNDLVLDDDDLESLNEYICGIDIDGDT